MAILKMLKEKGMLLDQGKELFGNTLYTVGDIYTIAYTCNHFDTYEVLYNPKYTTLTPGIEVMFIGKVSIREGVFARVKPLYSDVAYDIYYTNLGGLAQCEKQLKKKEKSKKQLGLERKLRRLLKTSIDSETQEATVHTLKRKIKLEEQIDE